MVVAVFLLSFFVTYFRRKRRRCTTLPLPPFVVVAVTVTVFEVSQPEEPLRLVPIQINLPLDLI